MATLGYSRATFVRFTAGEELLMPGLRPSASAVATSSTRLHLSLLGHLERVVDLDPEVSDGAFKFAVAEEKLGGQKIPVRR